MSDDAALNLSDDQRRGIVGYLEIVKGGAQQNKKVELPRPLHPFVKESLGVLGTPFVRVILEDQDCFRSEKGWQTLLSLLPSSDERAIQLQQRLQTKWNGTGEMSSTQRWEQLVKEAKDIVGGEKSDKQVNLAVFR